MYWNAPLELELGFRWTIKHYKPNNNFMFWLFFPKTFDCRFFFLNKEDEDSFIIKPFFSPKLETSLSMKQLGIFFLTGTYPQTRSVFYRMGRSQS